MKSIDKRIGTKILVALSVFFLLAAEISLADIVQISPSKDNTLYQNATGSLSNGAGWHSFVGRSSQTDNISRKRGIIAFNFADSIPSGSTIQTVTLRVRCSKVPNATARTISLRTVLGDWGEGTSNAIGEEGSGVVSTTNSVTWVHQFYNSNPWNVIGGDFSGTASSSVSVGAVGTYTFASTAQMVADVQNWLDNPSTNFGWILLGVETAATTVKRFDTKENPTVGNRPLLTVTFDPPCCIGIRGDIDGNGTTADVQDLTYMINGIYRGGPASPCPEEADLDNNGTPSTVQDLTYLINNIFRGGPNPPACP